jgi:CRP/FNR family transcriptional regulator
MDQDTKRIRGIPLAPAPGPDGGYCPLAAACLSAATRDGTGAALCLVPARRRMVRRGMALYRAGDGFQDIFVVASGAFKSIVVDAEGNQHISAFPMAGDVLGLDGLAADRHRCDAIALEDSQVCALSFTELARRCRDDAGVQQLLYRTLAAEIARMEACFLLLGGMCAQERLANFLLDLSLRFAARGYASGEFNLRMTRQDIGCYLGMKLETVSRTLSRFQECGWVDVAQKRIVIRNFDALRRVARAPRASTSASARQRRGPVAVFDAALPRPRQAA